MKRLVSILLIGVFPISLMAARTSKLKGRFTLVPQRSACAFIAHTLAGRSAAGGYASQPQTEETKQGFSSEVLSSYGIHTESPSDSDLSDPPARPPFNLGSMLGQVAVSSLVGAGVFVVFYLLAENDDSGVPAALALAGYPTAVAASVYVMGSLGKQTGSFGVALLGSLVGTGIVLALLVSESYPGPYFAAGIAPLMSSIAFNLTRRYKSPPQASPALVNIKDGKLVIGVPALCILTSPYKPRSVDVSVPLLSLEVK